MGPRYATERFVKRVGQLVEAQPALKGVGKFEVTLYGSLAATGRGHLTDVAINDILMPLAETEIIWHPDVFLPLHPNGMKFRALSVGGDVIDDWTIYSVGGGDLAE